MSETDDTIDWETRRKRLLTTRGALLRRLQDAGFDPPSGFAGPMDAELSNETIRCSKTCLALRSRTSTLDHAHSAARFRPSFRHALLTAYLRGSDRFRGTCKSNFTGYVGLTRSWTACCLRRG